MFFMQKIQDYISRILTIAVYIGISILLLWRAETYQDTYGRALLLDRVMCILLAILVGIVGLMRGLALLDLQKSV
jgi:hypothetical protein